jgi:hypothetical protein
MLLIDSMKPELGDLFDERIGKAFDGTAGRRGGHVRESKLDGAWVPACAGMTLNQAAP